MINDLEINENIEEAETFPATFYQSQEIFDLIRERIFVRCLALGWNGKRLIAFF